MIMTKNFYHWLQEVSYNQSIDGPPLQPHTISGAEVQIRQLASNIRTTFNLDPQWKDHQQQILKATQLLDQAADMLDDGSMGGDLRNAPHKYHR
jgi:hypothetical protein